MIEDRCWVECQDCDWVFMEDKPENWGNVWYDVQGTIHGEKEGHTVLQITQTIRISWPMSEEEEEE